MAPDAIGCQRRPVSNNPNKPLVRVPSDYATSHHLNDAIVDQIERNTLLFEASGPASQRHAYNTASHTDPRKNGLRTLDTPYGGVGQGSMDCTIQNTAALSNAAGR